MTLEKQKSIIEKYCTKKNVKFISLDEELEIVTIEFPNGKRNNVPVCNIEMILVAEDCK